MDRHRRLIRLNLGMAGTGWSKGMMVLAIGAVAFITAIVRQSAIAGFTVMLFICVLAENAVQPDRKLPPDDLYTVLTIPEEDEVRSKYAFSALVLSVALFAGILVTLLLHPVLPGSVPVAQSIAYVVMMWVLIALKQMILLPLFFPRHAPRNGKVLPFLGAFFLAALFSFHPVFLELAKVARGGGLLLLVALAVLAYFISRSLALRKTKKQP